MNYIFPAAIADLVIPFDEEIVFNGFTAVGYIPYEGAHIFKPKEVSPPRKLLAHIENQLTVSDNKWVVFFIDHTIFGTDDFAVYFKDAFLQIGAWDEVKLY